MNQLKSILVGVDFSDCSRSALAQALRMARWNNAQLKVLHALEHIRISDAAWTSHIPHEKLEADALAEARTGLLQCLREAGASKEVGALVDLGSPIDCILRRVRENAVDLLVLGVKGDSMIPMGAGTLATKCLRKSPSKVMLVHGGHTGAFRRIITGVDFSEGSRDAIRQALHVARQDNAHVHFVHVFSGSWGRSAVIPDAWEVSGETASQYRQALEGRLREFVGDVSGSQARFGVVEAGSHGHGLAEYALRFRADLLVLGSKGRSNLAYVMLGTTVERLLREIPCSALVVRPPVAPPQA